MEEGKQIEAGRQRAEVFDALGHPTRIAILKALSEGALGFAELKKKTAIESSGHLQHHLTKLNGLIKTDEYGKYCLSEQGKDALLTVQTVENISAKEPNKPERTHLHYLDTNKILKIASLLLVTLLIMSSAVAVWQYNQASALQKQIDHSKVADYEAMAYYNEFGVIPATNVNSSFSPPISVYHALQLALSADGWNKTSLNGMIVGAYLMNWKTATNSTGILGNGTISFGQGINGPLTTPPTDYSATYGDGVIYRYVWQIVVNNSTGLTIPPIGFTLIDAATGQILPNPPLF